MIIISLFLIIINLSIYNYIVKLEKENCKCATNLKMVKFIKPASIFVVLASIFETLLLSDTKKNITILLIINLICTIYHICLVVYYFELTNCKCSKKREKILLLYPLIVYIFVFLIGATVTTYRLEIIN
jgi:hypothetical protein